MTKYIFLLGTAMICCTIFFFSSQSIADSGRVSNYVAEEITATGKNIIKTEKYREGYKKIFINHIRKWAHAWLYFVMAIMVYGYILHFRRGGLAAALITVAICFCYACTDEFHQLFSMGRGSRFSDVLIDSGGAAVGTLLTHLVYGLYLVKNSVINNQRREK